MATTERSDEHAPADRIAASLGDAGFVRVVAAPRGDTLAALGVLCRALDDRKIPFRAAIRRATDTDDTGEPAETVALGLPGTDATHDLATDPVAEAVAVATALSTPDPVLGLAGTLASATVPTGTVHDEASAAGLSRRPGLAVPTSDPVDGLTHSTLVHGPFSADMAAARAVVGEFEPTEDARRRLASDVALAVAESAPTASRAGTALERILRPHAGGPLETVGGFADVLDALARREPGIGVAAVLGDVDADAALSVWRAHSQAVHEAVAGADLRRHDGIVAADADVDEATVGPVARLLRDYRSPEPAVFVAGPNCVALAVGEDFEAASLLREYVDDETVVDGHQGVAAAMTAADAVETSLRDALGGDP